MAKNEIPYQKENIKSTAKKIYSSNPTQLKLKELKSSGVRLIATDYDGTVFDRNDSLFNNPIKTIRLMYEVVQAGVEFMLISARNTTLEVGFRELVSQFCKKKGKTLTIWRSGGNGMNLVKITYNPDFKKTKVETIYSNNISDKDINGALNLYKKTKIKPDLNSCVFFKQFLDKKIPEDLVSKKYLKLMKSFNGSVFAEAVKISFVLPNSSKEHKKIVEIFKRELEPLGLNVGYGGLPFVDISRKMEKNGKLIDGKSLAVNTVMEKLNINQKQVAVFGDAPEGNDVGLLSLPYSFTNYKNLRKKDINSPPYILKVDRSKVASVHKAIRYLISK